MGQREQFTGASAVIASDYAFTTGKVATICQVAARTAAKWIDSGALPGYRIPLSKDRRVRCDHLLRFMRRNGLSIPEFLDPEAPCRLLLVGLEPRMEESLKACFLEQERDSINAVSSTFNAGLHVGSFHPECLVVDMAIGRVDAGQIAQGVRGDDQHRNMVLVALATLGCPGDTEWLQEIGFDHVFSSAPDLAFLAGKLKQFIHQKRDRQLSQRSQKCHHRMVYSSSS